MGFAALACTLALAPARISWARSDAKQGMQAAARQVQSAEEETVIFNTQSLKYLCPSCGWAQKCTRNCVPLSLKKRANSAGCRARSAGADAPHQRVEWPRARRGAAVPLQKIPLDA
jgi:hypothetical protein